MIYVAASSAEIERAEKWMNALRGEGIAVTSVWPETIRRVQRERHMASTHEASNPRQATVADRRTWALENVAQIHASEALWLLVPMPPNLSEGAYYELAVANERRKLTLASGGGDNQRMVFTALAQILFDADELAFEAIKLIYKRRAAL
jgi:hypothetical protein